MSNKQPINSHFYLSFSIVFVIASWLNTILAFVAHLLDQYLIATVAFILIFTCIVLAIIFYIIFRVAANREDLEIIKAIDEEFNNKRR